MQEPPVKLTEQFINIDQQIIFLHKNTVKSIGECHNNHRWNEDKILWLRRCKQRCCHDALGGIHCPFIPNLYFSDSTIKKELSLTQGVFTLFKK